VALVRDTVRGALWTISTGMGSRAIGLVGTLLLTRFVAPEEYGEVTVAVVLVMTANQFSSLGLGQYLVARPESDPSTTWHVTTYHVLLGLLALFGVLAFAGPLGRSLDAPGMVRFLPGLALATLLDRISFVPERLLVRDLRFGPLSGTRSASEVLYSVTCVGLAALGWGALAIVIGNVVRSVVRLVLFAALVKRKEWLQPYRLTLRQTSELFAFGVPMALGALAAFAARRWDNLLVARFFGPGPAGMYNLAYNLADVPAIQVGEQIGDVLLPSFARLEPERRGAALVRSMSLLGLVVFPLAVGLGAVAPTLVSAIFDPRWQPMAPMLLLLSALSVARPVGWTIASYLQARQLPRLIFWLEGWKLLWLVLCLVTFGRVSPLFACAAVGVAFAAHALASLWVVRRIDGVPLAKSLGSLLPASLACLPMVGGVLGLRKLLEILGGVGPVVGLTLEIVAGALCYALGAVLFARHATRDLVARVLDAVRPARRRTPSAGQPPP
jgi:lipopolysaccharide exporter